MDCRRRAQNNAYSKYTIADCIKFYEEKQEIPNKKFKILELVPTRYKDIPAYQIECLCGITKIYGLKQVNRNTTCGSKRCPYGRNSLLTESAIILESKEDNFFLKRQAWCKYRSGATKRNLSFEITPEDVLSLWKKQKALCCISGMILSCGPRHEAGGHSWSINRKDSSKGYTIDNIELVHKFTNMLLQDYSLASIDVFLLARLRYLLQKDKDYLFALKEGIRKSIEENNGKQIEAIWRKQLSEKFNTSKK